MVFRLFWSSIAKSRLLCWGMRLISHNSPQVNMVNARAKHITEVNSGHLVVSRCSENLGFQVRQLIAHPSRLLKLEIARMLQH